ncbi:hypothetical protein AMK16_03975 [Streptomyces sp. CB00455]|uniref:hypothetical protein n=1 Tax=Streptomyces sp. CB00455 TaxID=1703927 RepID=UPI00093F7055|nr:hypothetical protein [Streptomyces sp. CB00455]OKK22320.1 hypothetical protein AMK16_03975 [Streptomyces sp. CB00455]
MGAIRTSATALLSAGATGAVLALGLLGAPAVSAAEAQITSFGFAITPSTVAPGGQTVLSVTGCNAAYATASSGVFDTVSIARGRSVRVTVDRDARPGALYSVSFTCNGETGSADLTIAGGTSRPTTSSTRTTTPAPYTVPSSAQGVRGGIGGSVAGMDPVELAGGAGLLLAAAGGTAYAVRHRSGAGRDH